MPLESRGERSLKKVNAEAQRRAMNERRHEYTNRIRKAKKSQLVELKRRYVPPPTPIKTNTTTCTVEDLAWDYIRSKSPASLEALESSLSATSDTFVFQPVDVIPNNKDTPAMQLANTLAYSLTADTSMQVRLLACRVLTNLAAMEQRDGNDDIGYYGRQPEGWCHVLSRSQALPALAHVLASFASQVDPSYMSFDGPVLEVCQQCCWAVGNLAGDSQSARDAARQAGVVQPLVTVLSKGMELKHTAICRNAAWALSNLTRGVTTSGKEFCGPSLLTPMLVASVLMSPEQQLSTTVFSFWWMDVANEMCWLLAFLTAREDEVVDFLCQPSTELAWLMPHTQSVVCAALSHRLDQAARAARTATVSTSRDTALRALRMTVPCLRSIGNIAASCQGRHVGTLLHKTTILNSLNLLIASGAAANNGDMASVAVEAAWAAGALLCDAGLLEHPSTMHACPVLLPVLCQTVISEYAKLDLKREAVLALWNAVASPPTVGDARSSLFIRNGFLQQIAECPGMVVTLTGLMLSVDADLALGSVRLINALLRRLEGLVLKEFVESNGVDALEAVCDKSSQDNTYGGQHGWQGGGDARDEYTETAADLIDDFFGDKIEGALSSMESSPQGTFLPDSFSSIDSKMPQMFDFHEQQSQSPAFPNASSGTAGRGRGRGKTMPAWMQRA